VAYTYGTRWTDEKIKEEIFNVMIALEIERMPSSVEIERITGDTALTNAIARRGGVNKWAKILKLGLSKCETRIGQIGEYFIKELLENKGYIVEKMSLKHPYDLLVNENVKIDVKTSNIYNSSKGWSSYSFNLEKSNPTCDIYTFICMKNKKPNKILVIPSKFLHQTQLCITNNESKYDSYKDKWSYIDQYDKFYKNIV
jgi:hypothetical protein